MKKVILFTDSLGAGGAQRQLCGLAVLLQQEGYHVKVCTYHEFDFYKSYLDANHVCHDLISCNSSFVRRVLDIYRYLKNERPDWVIAYQETPSLISSLVKLMGCRYNLIVSERNTTQQITIKDRVRFFLYRYVDIVVPNSYSQENFLANRYRWMQERLITITNFVDLNTFSYNVHARNNCPLIVIAASIWPPKNTLGFIEALRILVNRGLIFCVKWYGYSEAHDEYFQNAQSRINEYGLNNYIELLPKTKNIKEVYRQSDYFCLPSFYEGMPNVIAEAMATGRPILCSNVCDNSIYVSEGKNGFLFDPSDPESIADAIERSLAISDLQYEQMCHMSRLNAETMLSEKVFIEKYVNILSK